ncbi:hypothetical protein R6K88_12020, partial [Enterococcus faecium]|nr:hypothetical protein [Enterococcus faecium]
QRSNGFGLTAGRNDEILTRWNLEKILTNRVRGIDSNPVLSKHPNSQVHLIYLHKLRHPLS